MKKILQIGTGGIGSFTIREIFNLYENSVQGTEDIDITMIDDDEVEQKNLLYQHFLIEDLGKNKAEALSERFLFNFKKERVETEKQLEGYDIILICVDNGKLRELVYKFCNKNETHFIDLRSEGRSVCYYTKHKKNTLESLMNTIDVEAPDTSCQLKFELDAGIIQIGNRIIAMVGVQLLLNHLRGEKNGASFVQRF